MGQLRAWKFPLILALCAMITHVLMSFVPAVAAPASRPGQELSLAEALMVVCTADGATSQGKLSHDNCNHCTTCASISARPPLSPLLAIIYPANRPEIWRRPADLRLPAPEPPHARPFAQGPPNSPTAFSI